MYLTTSLAVGLVAITASVSADFQITFPSGGGTFIPPPKSKVLSLVRAAASTQVTQSAFAAEISKIPEAKGHNIPSDIAVIANELIYSMDTRHLPAWFSDGPTSATAIASAIESDLDLGEKSRIEGATKVTGTGVSAAIASATKDAAEPYGDTSTETKASGTTTATKTSDTSTKTSATEKTTSTSTTSSSNAGGASQPTGAIMAAGAAAAGVLGIAAML